MSWWGAVAHRLLVGTWALGTFLAMASTWQCSVRWCSSICQAVLCTGKWQYEFNILKHINLIRFHFTFASFHTIESQCTIEEMHLYCAKHSLLVTLRLLQANLGDDAQLQLWVRLLQLKQVLTKVSIIVLKRLKALSEGGLLVSLCAGHTVTTDEKSIVKLSRTAVLVMVVKSPLREDHLQCKRELGAIADDNVLCDCVCAQISSLRPSTHGQTVCFDPVPSSHHNCW